MKPEQQATHLAFCKEQVFSDRPDKTKDAFSNFFNRMIKKLNEES